MLAKLLSAAAEPELALRHGSVVAPRLVRAGSGTGALRAPTGAEDYRVAVIDPGRLDGVSLVAAPELCRAAGAGQVRVSVRAAGMNFRDVLIERWDRFEVTGHRVRVCRCGGSGRRRCDVGCRLAIECLDWGIGCFGTRAVTPTQLHRRKIPAETVV